MGATSCLIGGLHVKAQQGLGIRRPQVVPPVGIANGKPIELVELSLASLQGFGHGRNGPSGVSHFRVDFPRGDVAAIGRNDLGEALAALTHQFQHDKGGNDTRIGAKVVLEVVVT